MNTTRNCFFVLASFALFACFPPTMIEGEASTDSETGAPSETDAVSGDGDGNPGDGDGDSCVSTAVIECDDLNRCWAKADGWPAFAQWADPVDMQNGIDAGTLIPDDLGLNGDCYTVVGGHHVCVVVADCTPLLGQPISELQLVQSDCAPVGGPWTSVGFAGNACWGTIGKIAVQLVPEVGLPLPGEMWGPCLADQGAIGLCNSQALACVSADDGAANICLPLDECPNVVPLGLFGELGWGNTCYPRCGQDSECTTGQVCAMADTDGGSVCAWPTPSVEPPCEVPLAIGCACTGMDCSDGLMCNGVGCTPCPAGSPQCPCDAGEYCEVGLCVASMCDPEPCDQTCPGDYACIDNLCVWQG